MSCSTRFVFPFGLKLQKYLLFCEIKFLICIPEINSVKFAIFKTQFAKVSSLEIFSHQNIFFWGIINLTNGKGSHAQKRSMLKNAFSVVYSLLKIKSKAYILENIFTILSGRINHVGKKCRCDAMILLFTSAIASTFTEYRRDLERLTSIWKTYFLYISEFEHKYIT